MGQTNRIMPRGAAVGGPNRAYKRPHSAAEEDAFPYITGSRREREPRLSLDTVLTTFRPIERHASLRVCRLEKKRDEENSYREFHKEKKSNSCNCFGNTWTLLCIHHGAMNVNLAAISLIIMKGYLVQPA